MNLLPAIEMETRPQPDATVIWLHGLGADGNDFAPIVPELMLPAKMAVRFIFPHAPSMPVTVNGGFVMPAWYDIYNVTIDRQVDTEGIMRSANAITAFINREKERGIAANRVVLAGFSQGGAIAYQVALSHEERLAGLLSMSTYLATEDSIYLHRANKTIPVAVHHGLYDPVVPEKLGREAARRLEQAGYKVTYRSYPMEHSVCAEQIIDISAWLQGVLA